MNREEVKALIEEWMHKPPGSRPLLEDAIAEQYRKSREGQWLGLRADELLAWLREAMAGIAHDAGTEIDLESRIAHLLTEEERGVELGAQRLPLAALRSTTDLGLANGTLPSDEDISLRVMSILQKLDKKM
jgi:hypothetical protein